MARASGMCDKMRDKVMRLAWLFVFDVFDRGIASSAAEAGRVFRLRSLMYRI